MNTAEKNKPSISVIIPVYNAELYLRRCVESVLQQSFSAFEIILVDDGSTDKSGTICDELACVDDRVKVIHKENGGVSAARNLGLEVAKGDYITFIDSDDFVGNDFFWQAVQSVKQHDVDLYVCGLVMETYSEEKIVNTVNYKSKCSCKWSVKELFEAMEYEYPQICICGPWCKLYSRQIVEQHAIRFQTDMNYGEDTFFNLDYMACIQNVYFSGEIHYHYCRSNAESLYSRFHPDTYEIHTKVYGKMRKLIQARCCSTVALERFEKMYYAMLLGGIHEYYRFREKTTREERRAQIYKVARDKSIKKLMLSSVDGCVSKMLLLALKCKMISIVELMFSTYYLVRGNKLS